MAILAMLASGCESDPGRLLVLVGTDYLVPTEAARLFVTTRDPRGAIIDGVPLELTTPEMAVGDPTRFAMPLSFIVVPTGGDSSRRADIGIEAYAPDVEPGRGPPRLTTRRVVSGFTEAQTRVVPMYLARDCESVTCAPDETCTLGGCQPVEVAASTLTVASSPVDAANVCAPELERGTASPFGDASRVTFTTAITSANTVDNIEAFFVEPIVGSNNMVVIGSLIGGATLPGGSSIGSPGDNSRRWIFVATIVETPMPPMQWTNVRAFETTGAPFPTVTASSAGAYAALRFEVGGSVAFTPGSPLVAAPGATILVAFDASNAPAWTEVVPSTGFNAIAGGPDGVLWYLFESRGPTSVLGEMIDCDERGGLARIRAGVADWTGCAVRTGGASEPQGMTVGPDGSVYYSVPVTSGTDLGGGPRNYNFMGGGAALVKLSADGVYQWDVPFERAYVWSISVAPGGEVRVAGTMPNANLVTPWRFGDQQHASCTPTTGVHVTALDASGRQRWTRVAPVGGTWTSVVSAPSGDTYLQAQAPLLDGRTPSSALTIMRLDPDGALRWTQEVDIVASASPAIRNDGQLIALGTYGTPSPTAPPLPATTGGAGAVIAFTP